MSNKLSRILVTGGTGFLGAHIVDLLLERGVAVVVTARSESKAKGLIQRRSRFKDLLKVIITGDLSTVGAFDDPAKDVDVIIHCASPLPNEPPGSTLSKTVIEPAIFGTLSILQAARKNPTLKRLIFTSSTSAVFDLTKDPAPGNDGGSYTADDWTPITYEEGLRSDNPLIAYRVAKKFAELEAWVDVDPTSKHLRQLQLDPSYPGYGNTTKGTTPTPNTCTFDMTVICPPVMFGPWVHPLGPSGLASLNHSNYRIRNMVRGDYHSSSLPHILPTPWVDVRDAALAHVEAALRLDSVSSDERYMVSSPEKFNYHLVAEIIREEFPEWADEVLPPKEETPPFRTFPLDGTPAMRDLGVTYRSFRECIVDLVHQLREEVLREAEANPKS